MYKYVKQKYPDTKNINNGVKQNIEGWKCDYIYYVSCG